MIVTTQMMAHIERALEAPLKAGEMRHIKQLGNLWATTSKLNENENGVVVEGDMTYWLQYQLPLNGITYYFYGGKQSGVAN